jgi:hypothetical protein
MPFFKETKLVNMQRETSNFQSQYPVRLLLLRDSFATAEPTPFVWKFREENVINFPFTTQILPRNIRASLEESDIVLIDVTKTSHKALQILKGINAAVGFINLRPRLLCFSTMHRNPQFQLAIEKCGSRYVRIADTHSLQEAIDVALAETRDFEHNGPCFTIWHRFMRGGCCAPGEEIYSISIHVADRELQLPLGLAQRFVFNFLAQRRFASDSQQIVSGLSGDWFYREHAANSSYEQTKKIQRATVKVLVQRIREAMAFVFEKAQLKLDPADVLRSCPVVGSKKVLYKLRAEILWRHTAR